MRVADLPACIAAARARRRHLSQRNGGRSGWSADTDRRPGRQSPGIVRTGLSVVIREPPDPGSARDITGHREVFRRRCEKFTVMALTLSRDESGWTAHVRWHAFRLSDAQGHASRAQVVNLTVLWKGADRVQSNVENTRDSGGGGPCDDADVGHEPAAGAFGADEIAEVGRRGVEVVPRRTSWPLGERRWPACRLDAATAPNLTEISRRHNNTYPSELVFQVIDGREKVRRAWWVGHAGLGDAFQRSVDGGSDEVVRNVSRRSSRSCRASRCAIRSSDHPAPLPSTLGL